ncbi:unnamed protein product [Moneuplotes crassus]|uniref:Uncharacterized protein n=1 Tax=Euplotes crassus TaxID=5936 RepID=A0AAD1YAE6_EUPCR|nr:unnamed protein product [Moneuplotes crassus]
MLEERDERLDSLENNRNSILQTIKNFGDVSAIPSLIDSKIFAAKEELQDKIGKQTVVIDYKFKQLEASMPSKIATQCLQVKGLIGHRQKFTSYTDFVEKSNQYLEQIDSNVDDVRNRICKIMSDIDSKISHVIDKETKPFRSQTVSQFESLLTKIEALTCQMQVREN